VGHRRVKPNPTLREDSEEWGTRKISDSTPEWNCPRWINRQL